ncbi:hypothetical protein CBR_g24092 [Chara braunii]|uniref:glycine--tRNA ligase n=1 Tax=Chara braunii TaxID=69332 RepID=A0A388L5S4_CHABU|nr:hypothetical protein CBR_g24092 [Chara braunii]|eukprot:GBG77644.1 hypothetical protein CBR_g24092 [Chara braunii]
MGMAEDLTALRAAVEADQEDVARAGDTVRELKARLATEGASAAGKAAIDEAIEQLKRCKIRLEESMKQYTLKSGGAKGDSANREAFNEAVNNALRRRLFYIPAFEIYGGVAGLYDYGPPGCAVKTNVLRFWRQHFVLEENMLEVDCPSVTPRVVLQASGHVEKFTDLMVKDVVKHTCYRADHLLKDHIEKLIEKDPLMDLKRKDELKTILVRVDELTEKELGSQIKAFGIKAPETGNDLSDPYAFNLMLDKPSATRYVTVYMAISPRAGLLRVREFTLAEIEHFVHPDNKSHPKFANVADLKFQLYPRAEQLGPKETVIISLGDAVKTGTINNETLGYFIGRTYLFLTELGIDKAKLRFRQHLQHEMAHYATDCWDAEIECTYGWVECVGIADRSAYDLTSHADASKKDLSVYEPFDTPREVEVLSVVPNKKEIGKAFKKEGKLVESYLESLKEEEAMDLKLKLDAAGRAVIKLCTNNQQFELVSSMVRIAKEKKIQKGRNIVPAVIEPSFGIGRIIYCMYEHSFGVRKDDEQRTFFKFLPLVAPIKCTVFPLVQDKKLETVAMNIAAGLTATSLSNKVDVTGNTIGKRYARTDELGVPFAITVDFQSLQDNTVTLRERDSCNQVRISVNDVVGVVKRLCENSLSWVEVLGQYPSVERAAV